MDMTRAGYGHDKGWDMTRASYGHDNYYMYDLMV